MTNSHTIDAYVLLRRIGDDSIKNEAGEPGRANDGTAESRLAGGFLSVDYSGEIAVQFGRWSGDQIRTWALALTAGYNIDPALLSGAEVRLGIEYDFASGDPDPFDGEKKTFDPLFSNAHAYQGYQDLVGWQNVQNLAFSLGSLFPHSYFLGMDLSSVFMEMQYHFFWLA